MPHIIVEYSKSVATAINMPDLLESLHHALADSGIDIDRIKTRGVPLDYALAGAAGYDGAMIHGTLLLLEGRDIATKKKHADPLFALIQAAAPAGCKVSFEVRDMVKDTYYL